MARRKRRSWSKEEKRSICLQTLAPGVSVAQVARRYAMNANQIFNWLKDARFAPDPEDIEADITGFIPVDVCCEPSANSLASDLEPANASRSHGRVEIALSGGHRLIVEGGFDGAELARLLKGLVS
ncbi:MAG: transposase [Hyphomicrobiales bacterium]|nr:transposase [Hyphomicrobiales bacterium]